MKQKTKNNNSNSNKTAMMPKMSQEEEQKSIGKEVYGGLDIDTGNRKRWRESLS